jgi:hypothetical protein
MFANRDVASRDKANGPAYCYIEGAAIDLAARFADPLA